MNVAHQEQIDRIKAARARMGIKPTRPVIYTPPAPVEPEPARPVAPLIVKTIACNDRRSIVAIQRVVADYYGYTVEDLTGGRRTKKLIKARHVAMYLCRHHTGYSSPFIATKFGDRDHTTVLHGAKKLAELLNHRKDIAQEVETICHRLGLLDASTYYWGS